MQDINLTITSVIRPDLLQKVLESVSDKIFLKTSTKYQISAIVNVDSIGDPLYSAIDVINVVNKFFPVIYANISSKPCFTKAVKSVWRNSFSKYVFHLEDMWLFLEDINLESLIEILDNHPKIACINLHKVVLADGSQEPGFYKSYKDDKKYRKLFLEIEKPLLSPGLWRGEFVRNFSHIMNDVDNPELQLWGDKKMSRDSLADEKTKEFLGKWDYAIFSGNWLLPFWRCRKQVVSLEDGRKWKRRHKFYKENPWSSWKKRK
jgi:hypothetical protein